MVSKEGETLEQPLVGTSKYLEKPQFTRRREAKGGERELNSERYKVGFCFRGLLLWEQKFTGIEILHLFCHI